LCEAEKVGIVIASMMGTGSLSVAICCRKWVNRP